MISDLMRYAKAVPGVPTERIMNLAEVIAARDAVPDRPAWAGIFAKALALTACEFPELRRAYVKWPWPHLFEYPVSVGGITVQRHYRGEPFVFVKLIKDPASLPIAAIARLIDHCGEAPIEEIKNARLMLSIGRLPGLLRRPLIWIGFNFGRQRSNWFGTFTVTSVAFAGADLLHVPSPITSLLTFGVFGPDGRARVRLVIDHRVMDGMAFAAILTRLEEIMRGPILRELQSEAAARLAPANRGSS